MSFDEHETLIRRTDKTLQRLEQREIARLQKAFDRSYLQLERQLLTEWPKYGSDAMPGLLANQRALLLLDKLKSQMPLISPQQKRQYEKRFQEMLSVASQEGVTLGEELVKLNAKPSFILATTDIPVEAIAASARDTVRRLSRYDEKFQDEASTIIQQGMIQGWGSRRVGRQLRQRLGVSKASAERIARTEILSSQDTATRQSYANNGVGKYIRIATEDHRVCPQCADRAGQVYDLNVPVALHPNDRCYAAPWLDGYDDKNSSFAKWAGEHRQAAIAYAGEKPEGKAPFEKMNDVPKAQPLWKPEEPK